MLAALTERYSNIAIGKILEVSEAAVRMMLKRAGIRRVNRVFSSLDDWQAAIIRAELKAEMARKEKVNGTVDCRLSQVPLAASVDRTSIRPRQVVPLTRSPSDNHQGMAHATPFGSCHGPGPLLGFDRSKEPRLGRTNLVLVRTR